MESESRSFTSTTVSKTVEVFGSKPTSKRSARGGSHPFDGLVTPASEPLLVSVERDNYSIIEQSCFLHEPATSSSPTTSSTVFGLT